MVSFVVHVNVRDLTGGLEEGDDQSRYSISLSELRYSRLGTNHALRPYVMSVSGPQNNR